MSSTLAPSHSLADLLRRTAERRPERVAVRYPAAAGWHELTYAELAEIVERLALGLIDLGVEPGERVAILARPGRSGPSRIWR